MRKFKNRFKRGTALFLSLVMCVGMLQITAFADGENTAGKLTATVTDSKGIERTEYSVEFHPQAQSDDTDVTGDAAPADDSQDNSGAATAAEGGTTTDDNAQWKETVGPEGDQHEVDLTGDQTTDNETDEVVNEHGNGSYTDSSKGDGTVDVDHSEETNNLPDEEVDVPSIPKDPVEVTVKPDSPKDENGNPTGETDFTIDPSQVEVPKPTAPSGYTQVGDSEDEYTSTPSTSDIKDESGNTIGTSNSSSTWKVEKLPDSEGNGFKTTEQTITTTEVTVNNAPENRPDDAKDIEGGYQYTTTGTNEAGEEVTVVVTVKDGTTTTWTRTIKTTETVKKVSKDPITGKVTLTLHKPDGTIESVSVPPEWVKPDGTLKPDYDKYGWDQKNDLYDNEGSKGYMTVKINTKTDPLTVRTSPGGTKAGTIPKGTEVRVYEEKNGWYRIGENAWISASYTKLTGGTFKVTANSGLNVRSEPSAGGEVVGGREKGSVVRVIGISDDGKWYKVASDGNAEGWVSAEYLDDVKNGMLPTFAESFDPDKVDEIFKDETGKEYEYVYFGEKGLESSIRVDLENGSNTWQAHQFILRDKETNKYYVYCAELGTEPKEGYRYNMIPLEGVSDNPKDPNYVGHLNADDLQKIRAVAQNGYWGTGNNDLGSLEAMKAKLKEAGVNEEVLKGLTPGIALTATQAALWVYGNTNRKTINENTDDWIQYLGEKYYDSKTGKVTDQYNTLYPDQKAALKAAFEWLIGKNGEGATAPEVITKEDFKVTEAKVTVTGSETQTSSSSDVAEVMYQANVEFALNVTSGKDDQLYVEVYVMKDGKSVLQGRCPLNGEQTENENPSGGLSYSAKDQKYTINGITLPNGATLDIKLTGTQDLGKGVYVFKSEGDQDGDHSQTFIGLSESNAKQNVDLSVTLDFDVTAAKATITTKETVTTTRESWSSTWRDGSSTTTPGTPTTPPDDPTTPPDDPTVEVPEEDVPLSNLPEEPTEEVEIPEEDVPLAVSPQTGDGSRTALWAALSGFSLLGMLGLMLGKKRDEL